MEPADVVDLDRYPVLELGSAATAAIVARHRAELHDRGVSVLPGFVRPEGIARLVAECDVFAPHAFLQDVPGTPYLELPDEAAWPEGHPRRAWARSSVRTIGYDQIPPASLLRRLYEWPPLLAFLSAVLDRPVHPYADPMGALNVAVMAEGDELGWHFDQTDFVVSLAVQSSEAGGDFENAAHLRSDDDERYDAVTAVLDGRVEVVVEPMTPGTLMLFAGRRSLHRVTPVGGPRPRYVGLLGYDSEPGTVSSELLRAIRYGRSAPVGEPISLAALEQEAAGAAR